MTKTYRVQYNKQKIDYIEQINKNKLEIKSLRNKNLEIKKLLSKLNNDNRTASQNEGIKKANQIRKGIYDKDK